MTQSGAHETARHPNYVAIWVVLVVLLAASLASAWFGSPRVAALAVFSIAFAKAFLVVGYYMHLRFEPLWIGLAMFFAFLCVAVLFVGLVPDMVYIYGG